MMKDLIEVNELPENPKKGATYNICNTNVAYLTHSFFKYPCKYIPQIPSWAIKKYAKSNSVILDPFCGSGTTLVEASLGGHKGLGVEIDKFGQMLTMVKTTKVSDDFSDKISDFRKKVVNLDNYKKEKRPLINNFDLWFSKENAITLSKLNYLIDKTKNDPELCNFLKVCFASVIRKASNADEVSPKPYISKKYEKKKREISDEFLAILDKNLVKMIETSKKLSGVCQIVGGDARDFIVSEKVDLVVTSPPYINAFDYVRTLRLENLWLGLQTENELREIKKYHIGTESVKNDLDLKNIDFITKDIEKIFKLIYKKDKKRAFVVLSYFEAMKKNISTVKNNLKKGGYYVIVVGNSTIRGIDVETHKILIDIATNLGFNNDLTFSYIIKNRYLRIPRNGRGGFIKKDWIICLKK